LVSVLRSGEWALLGDSRRGLEEGGGVGGGGQRPHERNKQENLRIFAM